jgi:hypothetical protein
MTKSHGRQQGILGGNGPERAVAAARVLEGAEVAAERHLLLVGQFLVAEDEHPVVVHPRLDGGHRVARERARDVDPRHLAHEDRMDLANGSAHRDENPARGRLPSRAGHAGIAPDGVLV